MYIDHRTYTFVPGKMQAWIDLYEDIALPLQLKYLGHLVGFFRTEIGPLNQVIHMWAFDSLDERQRRRGEMLEDPAWQEFQRRVAALGALMHMEDKIIVPVGFSPIR